MLSHRHRLRRLSRLSGVLWWLVMFVYVCVRMMLRVEVVCPWAFAV